MSATLIATILSLLMEVLKAAPELVSDVKALIDSFEGKSTPPAGSMAAQILAQTQAGADKLK